MNHRAARPNSKVHRAAARPPAVPCVTDGQRNQIDTVTGPLKVEFRLELVAGTCVMGLPVALSEINTAIQATAGVHNPAVVRPVKLLR